MSEVMFFVLILTIVIGPLIHVFPGVLQLVILEI